MQYPVIYIIKFSNNWTITWIHEGNVIVEDQLTHSGSRTAPPKAVFCRSAKCEHKLTMILF